MGLNETYGNVNTNLLMRVPLPTVNEAYAVLIQAEGQRLISSSNNGAIVVARSTDSGFSFASGLSGSASQRRNNDPQRRILKCTQCRRRGHNIEFCWILHPELRNTRRQNMSINNDIKGKQIYNSAIDSSDTTSFQGSSNNSCFT